MRFELPTQTHRARFDWPCDSDYLETTPVLNLGDAQNYSGPIDSKTGKVAQRVYGKIGRLSRFG